MAVNKTKARIGILAACLVSLCYMAYSPIIASVAQSFPDVELSLVQMIMTIPSFMFIVFSPLAGKLTQKIKKKKLVLIALVLYLVGGLFPFFFHSSIWLILGGSVIIGCGSGLLMPIINSIICDYFEMEERAQLMGLNATFVALGALMFIFIGGRLTASFDWSWSFLSFLLLIPIIVVVAICMPDGKMYATESKSGGSGFEMNPYIAFLFVIGFVYFAIQNAFNTNSSLFVAENAIGDAGTASIVTMANTLGGIVGGAVFSLAVRKFQDQIETAAFALAAAGFLLTVLVKSLVPLLVGGLAVGVAFAFINAAGAFLLSKYLKPENNAFTVSVYLAVVNVGASLSPIVVNSISGIFGQSTATRYTVSGIVIAVCMAISLVVNKAHKQA